MRKRGKELTDLRVLDYYHDKSGIKIFYGLDSSGTPEIDIFKKNKDGDWDWKILYSNPGRYYISIYLNQFEGISNYFLRDHKIARKWFRRKAYTMIYGDFPLNQYLDNSGKLDSKKLADEKIH